MLAYAFQVLSENGYKNLSTEEFDNADNLLAAILEKGISFQIKKGLRNDYIPQSDITSKIRGKIDVTSSIKSQYYITKKLTCEFDDFQSNIQLNQIIKTAVLLAIQSKEIDHNIKQKLKKSLLHFGQIDSVPVNTISWNSIRFNRNNATYKMLINICYLLINGLIQTKNIGDKRLVDFIDEQKMHRLFEKFIFEYYKKHFPSIKVTASHIPWNSDDNEIDFLPTMKSDIILKSKGKTLIIDTKYYANSLQTGRFNKKTIHSNNLYQIFTYVKNYTASSTDEVSGMLLYAKTDEYITPDLCYKLSGNDFFIKTIDLNCDFKDILQQLNDLINNWE